MNFHKAVPILRVAELSRSLDYYQRILGFHIEWEDPSRMASVGRGDASLMLCEGGQGHSGTWVWIGVGDAAALHDEVAARGAHVRMPPTNFYWALETQIVDPDGHVLRFGSDPLENVPFGPWVD